MINHCLVTQNKPNQMQQGHTELLFILPILIVCLWGFTLISAIILEKQALNQHLWQASISNWNGHSFTNYLKAQDLNQKKLDFRTNKNVFWIPNLFTKLPTAFKIFQTKYMMRNIHASIKTSHYNELSTLNKWVKNTPMNYLNYNNKLLFPNPGRRKNSSKKLLKHGLWLQGMCDAKFNEIFLPILGTEILLEVSMGIKIPFKIFDTVDIPILRCAT